VKIDASSNTQEASSGRKSDARTGSTRSNTPDSKATAPSASSSASSISTRTEDDPEEAGTHTEEKTTRYPVYKYANVYWNGGGYFDVESLRHESAGEDGSAGSDSREKSDTANSNAGNGGESLLGKKIRNIRVGQNTGHFQAKKP